MIFGGLDEGVEQVSLATRQAAAAAAAQGGTIFPVQDAPATDRAPRPIFPESDAD